MRPWSIRAAQLAGIAFLAVSCSSEGPTAPDRLQLTSAFQPLVIGTGPAVRISEVHYDNSGTDTGESIEISGPAGTDLTGWSVVLYNGSSPTAAVTYGTARALTGAIPTTCNQRGVIVLAYPTDGIQNGPNDGVALVNAAGTVVELLSYEGALTAANGPAAGMTSTNIGVSEVGTTPIGQSLQRNPDGTWSGPIANTFGACNDGDENPGATPTVVTVTVAPATATVQIGATTALTATALDAAAAPIAGVALTWTSSADAIATVSSSGVVTGVAVGEATITAAAANGVSGTATITVEAAPPPPAGVRFSEIHYDNFGTDLNEAIEIDGPAGTDLTGWSIVLYNGNGGVTYEPTQVLSGVIAEQCDGRGTRFVSYPSNGIQNGAPDGMALVNAEGAVVEFLSYEGTVVATNGPAAGMTSTDIGALQNSDPVGTSLHRTPANTWASEPANFGYCYGVTPPPPPNGITFSGRDGGDPALPVGFEDQLFATLRSGADNAVIPTTFTWSSETPLLASVDADGVVRALGTGTAILKAVAADGTEGTYAIATTVATASATAVYAGNTEFGDPTDGDASDEIIIRRAQYTTSFSAARGIPNWVSYNLEATHFGAQDRCDCFTYDEELPAAGRYTTADYTGAGTVAGYGIDRGHLVRSFDRTSGSLDNATTFYFSNIIPQAADNNQGPWAQFENYVGDLARFSDREVYVIAGASGSKGTVKNEGRITIPTVTWKVVVSLPRNGGLASIDSWDDAQVYAVLMPNDPGIRNVAWQTYQVTVDAVEAASGFDLLSALRDDIEIALESNTQPPVAAVDGPWAAYAGDPLAMSGAASTDADGDALTYAWSFGDGATATGASTSHTYAAAGDYTVRLIVTDVRGLADTVTSTASITLLPPAVGIARARTMIDDLAGTALSKGEATSLLAKLNAAEAALARGNTTAVEGSLGALLNEIDALVQSGRLTAAQVDALREILGRTLDNL
jgi:DNA/RNA endonuclease G (NUC1)